MTAMRRWRRRILWALLIAVALPHLAILAYRFVPPPATPLMLWRLAQGHGLSKTWMPLDEISGWLPLAVIGAEDNRFCAHGGVDWVELREAWAEYRAGERVRGASTITMQLARNLLLWPGRDVVRKAIEIYLAVVIEALWPKRRIMEVYLNIVEWGPGLYGAEAAARTYFRRPAVQLSAQQAALMAVVLPNPREWHPDRATAYLEQRAATTRLRIDQLGARHLDCVR